MGRRYSILLAITLCLLIPARSFASGVSPAQAGESIRSTLVQIQLAAASDPAGARSQLQAAEATYRDTLAPTLSQTAPDANAHVQSGFTDAARALDAGDQPALADARSHIWTSLLLGSYTVVEHALQAGDGVTAQSWLPLREFRRATRFSRPDADATRAIEGMIDGTTSEQDALLATRAEMLDTYQARLTEALSSLTAASDKGYLVRRAEFAALADGYFTILAPAYTAQKGAPALEQAQAAFAELRAAARSGAALAQPISAVQTILTGFRAAPLSPTEQARRAGQLARFLQLVPLEYGRGVSNGVVTRDFEIQEAVTFRKGAAAAYADLQTVLEARDPRAAEINTLLTQMERRLTAALGRSDVASPDEIQNLTDKTMALLTTIAPPEWQQHDASGDFDVILSMLDQVEGAVAAGQYELAESARLEAYAILETGPEARIIVFAPEYKPILEDLFWYGQGEHRGLASLIEAHAPAAEIKASRVALDNALGAAQQALVGGGAPAVVATNAGIIVFREGLEAVLILASLMAGMRRGPQRRLVRPMWAGAFAALAVSALTWILARGVLSQLARYGERLEAIVSLIAIAILVLITNWFFHKAYWVDWMAQFQTRKQGILRGNMGQWVGLAVLGFTSVYREGFETVLFLQALVLESGATVVLIGVALGLAATALVGLIVFAIQRKLPFKKMLIVTGMMIVGVLVIMVGNTIHVLQIVGWLPIHPIRSLTLPYWTGLWFGLFATWEGIFLQITAAVFVVGSYFLAERMQHRRVTKVSAETASARGAL